MLKIEYSKSNILEIVYLIMGVKMDLIAKDITYSSGDAKIKAYIAYPDKLNHLPGLVIVHEIFGLNDHIRDVARRFANQGYAVIAPHLYSRPGNPTEQEIQKSMQFMLSIPPAKQRDQEFVQQEMSKLPEDERSTIARVWGWMTKRDYAENIIDLKSACKWLSSQNFVDKSKIGCMGFCMGGTLTGRLAAEGEDLKTGIIFYGESPPADKVENIKCLMMGLYGGEDHRITDKVPEFEKEMKAAGKHFVYYVYPGAHHAFFNNTGRNYDENAAKDAWEKCKDFLSQNLKG